MNLYVSSPYEIIVYSVLKHITATRMHTISGQFISLIYGPLGKRILSNIQPAMRCIVENECSRSVLEGLNMSQTYVGVVKY